MSVTMHVLSSLKDYATPLTDKVRLTPLLEASFNDTIIYIQVKDALPGGDEKAEKVRAADPEFEFARKEWIRLNDFLTAMLDCVVQTTAAHRGTFTLIDMNCLT